MELKHALNRLGNKTMIMLPRINSGGCCVFASLVGEVLRSKGVPVRVVVGAWNNEYASKTLEEARELIPETCVGDHNAWHDRDIYFDHLGLEIGTSEGCVLYDANGVQPFSKELDGNGLYRGRMALDDAIALANNPWAWNHAFDRDDIPRLKLLVHSELKELTVEPV